jgi:hypothetical protein
MQQPQQPTERDIRERSYFIWEQEGCPQGRACEHWLRAEAELRVKEPEGSPTKPRQGGEVDAKAGNSRRTSASAKGANSPSHVTR